MLVEFFEHTHHRQTANKLRNQPILQQVLRLGLTEQLCVALSANWCHIRIQSIASGDGLEAERLLADPAPDHLLQTDESSAADEENVGGVNSRKFLMRMLASTLRRNVCDGAFEELQQSLLDAFAGDVTRDGGVLVLAANLVDLVDVNDALLGAVDVTVGSLQQLQDDVLNIFADVAGLGQGGCVYDCERHVQNLGESLREERLA